MVWDWTFAPGFCSHLWIVGVDVSIMDCVYWRVRIVAWGQAPVLVAAVESNWLMQG